MNDVINCVFKFQEERIRLDNNVSVVQLSSNKMSHICISMSSVYVIMVLVLKAKQTIFTEESIK